jgi:hypothetical protein
LTLEGNQHFPYSCHSCALEENEPTWVMCTQFDVLELNIAITLIFFMNQIFLLVACCQCR